MSFITNIIIELLLVSVVAGIGSAVLLRFWEPQALLLRIAFSALYGAIIAIPLGLLALSLFPVVFVGDGDGILLAFFYGGALAGLVGGRATYHEEAPIAP